VQLIVRHLNTDTWFPVSGVSKQRCLLVV